MAINGQIYISSHDVETFGDSFDGTFTMSGSISTSLSLGYHFIDDKNIPWMYNGINVVQIFSATLGSIQYNFPQLDKPFDDVDQLLAVKNDITLKLLVLGITCDDLIALLGPEDVPRWRFMFSEVVSMFWDAGTAKFAFQGSFMFSTPPGQAHVIDVPLVDVRPNVMVVTIQEAESPGWITSHSGPASLHIPTSDFQHISQKVSIAGLHNTLDISWARTTSPGVICPMPNVWSLMFLLG